MMNSRLKWITTQIGAREHYLPPVALARRGVLEAGFTDFWAGAATRWVAKFSTRLRSVANRYEDELANQRMIAFNVRAVLKTWAQHHQKNGGITSLYDFFTRYGEWFARSVLRELRKWKLEGERHRYFGFNTGCLETIDYLREHGVFCVVQQIDPARTEQRLVAEEARRWRGWETDAGEIPDSYFARLENEWHQSSLVVVNSEWSRKAMVEQGVPSGKLVVIPLGYERPHNSSPPVRAYGGRPLRVVWLGSVTLRKGIPYLLEAARKLKKRRIEFIIAGPIAINLEAIPNKPDNVKFLGRVQRNDVPRIVAEADIYVLPTVSDGFALTQLEAMAQGLPVITTPNCGEVVTAGRDGFIVPARDSEALADAIAKIDDDRDLLARMAAESLNTVGRFSIENYGARLIAASDAAQDRQ